MDIGEKIRSARISKGMTQEELGKLLGVQKSAVAKYESGRVVNIKRSTLKKISDILEIRPSELISTEEMQKKNDALTDIVVRLRTDDKFSTAVDKLSQLDEVQLASVMQVVDTFLSMKG